MSGMSVGLLQLLSTRPKMVIHAPVDDLIGLVGQPRGQNGR